MMEAASPFRERRRPDRIYGAIFNELNLWNLIRGHWSPLEAKR